MVSTNNKKYREEIKKEEFLWNKSAENELKKFPPDYAYYKETVPYKIYRHKYINRMLSHIQRGDRVLELGCYNGWFSLEMAKRGAIIDAHDISKKAISIARKYYNLQKNAGKCTGKISYHVTDLNHVKFPKKTYEFIVIRNVLHHLTNLKSLFYQLKHLLKSDGKILVDDALPCGKLEALVTGVLLFFLPTDIPYSKKLPRIFKRGEILKRTQGLVDAYGASPFEGISGEKSLIYLMNVFKQTHIKTFAAFVGTIAAHIQTTRSLKNLLLKILNFIDILLIEIGVLRGTGYYLESSKA